MSNSISKIMNDNVNGATFIAMDTSTEPKLTGGMSNPFKGRVRKIMVGANVMVFQNKSTHGYRNMVQRRLKKEGKNPEQFHLSARTWGQRVKDTPFVEHNGNKYLEVIFLKTGKVHYEVDGVETDPTTIEGLTLDKKESNQGGLNDKVIIRTFKFPNIIKLTVNKAVYSDLVD